MDEERMINMDLRSYVVQKDSSALSKASMDQNRASLVSIVVITYNSYKYILKTLESAKAQRYC